MARKKMRVYITYPTCRQKIMIIIIIGIVRGNERKS